MLLVLIADYGRALKEGLGAVLAEGDERLCA